MNSNTDYDRIIGGNIDAAGQPGLGATGTCARFAAPLDAVTQGRLIFTNGAASLTLHAERGMPDLYRATFARRIPRVWVQDGTVSIQYRRFSFLHWLAELREPLAEIILNGSIAWEIEVRGGVSKLRADLRNLQLVALEAFSLGLSARLVMRFGIKLPLTGGLLLAAAGLALFARAPVDGNVLVDVVPSMILLGFGAGMAFNPLLLAAMSDIEPHESGLASGLVNTSIMMGGALGLAILASLAAARTASLRESGTGTLVALNGGYQAAFLVGALFAACAAVLGAVLLRVPPPAAEGNVQAAAL